jgi:hypothetical protein
MNDLGLWREKQVRQSIRNRKGYGPNGEKASANYGIDYKLDRDGNIIEWDTDTLGELPTKDVDLLPHKGPRLVASIETKKQHFAEEALMRHINEVVKRWRISQDATWQGNLAENVHPECRVVGGKRAFPNNPVIEGLPSGRRIVILDYDADRFGEPPTLDDLVEILKDVLVEQREVKAKKIRRRKLGEPIDAADAEKLANEEAAEVCDPAKYMRLLAAERAGDTDATSELSTIDAELRVIETNRRQEKAEKSK